MRNLFTLLAGALLALTLAAPAAQSLPVTGSLSLIVGTLPPIGPIPVVGGSGDSCSTCGSLSLTAGGALATIVVPVTNPTFMNFPAFPIVELALTGPAGIAAPAAFVAGAGPAGGIGGLAGLSGNTKIGLFGPPPFAFLTIPLSVVGGGGTISTMSPIGVNITVVGTGWTTGVAKVLGTTNIATPTLGTQTGADNRTVGGLGSVVLVTPVLSITNVSGSTNLPLFGVLTLNYVPEPGTLLLLGAGIAGLALRGRRARK